MFVWFTNIISGRRLHWNRAYGTYIGQLTELVNELPATEVPLLGAVTMASYTVVEDTLMPGDGRNRILKIDVKRITPEQFQAAHDLVTWTYVALFALQNPSRQDSSISACFQLIGMNENESEMVDYVLALKDIESEFSSLSSKVYYEFTKILDCENKSSLDWVLFSVPFALGYQFALDVYLVWKHR